MSEVTIYVLDPTDADDADEERSLALLDEVECARYSRFRFARHRRSFALSHGLVRCALSRHLDGPPRSWRFEIGEYGRPFLLGSALAFSLSHTDGLAAVAISEANVGVDVERIVTRGNTLDLAREYFAASEAQDVESRDGADKADRFFAYWTLKESYIKARSMGLALPLDGFWFQDIDYAPRIEFAPELLADEPGRWSFRRLRQETQVPLALCVESATLSVVRVENVGANWICA
jgi:4'-phosphopantetheinyl transferase